MRIEPAILLLGRRDHPTDGVADYCDRLCETAVPQGIAFETHQLRWAELGWRAAFAELRAAASVWRNRWVLLQYTTLSWSRRGFPLRAPRVLDVLRQCGARPGVVFHDTTPLAGTGVVGAAREYCHQHVLRQLYERCELGVFTLPLKNISWLPMRREKAVFIPVGANCPEPATFLRPEQDGVKTIAVYGVTGGASTETEVADIAFVIRQVLETTSPLRLLVFGRNSKEAEPAIRAALAGSSVEIEILGLISPEQVTTALARADAQLFVRGQISSRRGSAIAGIACGLPVVSHSGSETDWPITEAGVLTVPPGDRTALAGALANVLQDAELRAALGEKSRAAQQKYFSWQAIVRMYANALGGGPGR